jgi:Bacterial transcriptional activator domain
MPTGSAPTSSSPRNGSGADCRRGAIIFDGLRPATCSSVPLRLPYAGGGGDLRCREERIGRRVDVRVFDIERRAALAAAAADDVGGILVHAAAAIARYRGDLLPGMYDDWLLEARSELERQCMNLCDLIAETRAREGDLTGAERRMPYAAGFSCSRWRRSATAH